VSASTWPTARLGDHCTKIGSGATPRGGEAVYRDDGVALIRSQNVHNGYFTKDGLAHVDEKEAERLKGVTVQSNDLLLNITGDSVARSCRVPDEVLPARVNQHVAIVRPNHDRIDPRFLSYFLISPFMQSTMLSLSGAGGTRKALTKEMIEGFRVPLPPLPTQARIGHILSVYDDLIENNRRRIALLEEAARMIYREWFVHFRFPGHEHVKIIDGLPEGWAVTTTASVCSTYADGDWLETKDQGGSDYRILQISNIGHNAFVETGNWRFITEETFRKLGCLEVLPGDILVSRMPKPIGRGWMVTEMPFRMVTAVDVTVVRANGGQVEPHYLLHHINSSRNILKCEANATGATRPRISRKNMGKLPILLPPKLLQHQFTEFASKCHQMRASLASQIRKLSEARDLLLPRLMNGEIAV